MLRLLPALAHSMWDWTQSLTAMEIDGVYCLLAVCTRGATLFLKDFVSSFVPDERTLVTCHCILLALGGPFHSGRVQTFSLLVSNLLSLLFLIPFFLKLGIMPGLLHTAGIHPSFQSINHYAATACFNLCNTPTVYSSKPNDWKVSYNYLT